MGAVEMNILFIGCVESSEILLSILIKEKFNICGVITKKNSIYNSDFKNLDALCKINNLRYIYTDDVNCEKCIEFAKDVAPDIIYCFGWSQLLKSEILSIAPKGGIGFHPTSLPQNKGHHPIIWALALGLKETAVSFFKLNLCADDGEIYFQQKVLIDYEDDARSLYNKIMQIAKMGVIQISNDISNDCLRPIDIQCEESNIWRKRGIQDGIIDWRMSGKAIYNLVRALAKPYIGAEFYYKEKIIKVWKVEELVYEGLENIEYGKVIEVKSETDFCVKSYDNIIHVIECDPIELKVGEYL